MSRRLPLVLLLLLSAVGAKADYKDSYRKGIDALDRKRWHEVVRYMREAAAENPTEGERIKLYGLRFETYLPHFYLGAAYVNLGNCEQAVKSFETSRSQGAIRNHPKWPELLDGLKSCEGAATKAPSPTPTPSRGPDPAALAQAAQAAEAAVAAADDTGRSVASLAADPLLTPVWSREPALGRAEAEARDSLSSARAKADAGRRTSDLALLGEARDLAGRAKERFDGVRQAAERRRDALRREQVTTPAPSATPPPKAPEGGPTTPVDLLAGAQAYFGGHYEESIRFLDRVVGLKGRSGTQATLLRAAARHALYRAGGERDATLRRQAAEDVAASRRSDPSLAPDSLAFSPQFLEFFRSN
ncbi:MAG: hypothetical protein ACHQNV_08165 [Vicinamibacteria bacterium]